LGHLLVEGRVGRVEHRLQLAHTPSELLGPLLELLRSGEGAVLIRAVASSKCRVLRARCGECAMLFRVLGTVSTAPKHRSTKAARLV
jgi:hypothetical protein